MTPDPLAKNVRRYEHGSRVPGWDTAADLERDPATVPDPALTPVPPQLRTEIETAMAQYPDSRSAALPALHAAQRHHGWCSPEAIDQVACVMRLTPAYLESVATFYDMYEMSGPVEHHVYVCTNISCSLRGADELYEAISAEAAADDGIKVRPFECLGACDIAPMASIDGVYVGPLADEDVKPLIDDVRAGRDPLPGKQLIKRPSTDARAKDFS
jgi:NADH:ubiquinone oxidoreductase subunit E